MRIPDSMRRLWKLPLRLSLRASLLLLLCGMAVVVIQHGVGEALDGRAARIAQAQDQLSDIADAVAQRQTDLIIEVRAFLRVLTELPDMALASSSNCQFTLQRAVAELPYLNSVMILSTEGAPVCSSQPTLPTVRMSDRDYFRGAIRTGTFVLSDYVISRVTNKPLVVAAMPRVAGGEVASVFTAGIKLDWLSRIAAQAGIPAGTQVLVVDSVGTVIAAHPDGPEWVGKSMKNDPQYRTLMNAPALVTETVGADGSPRIAVSKGMPGTKARVLLEQPKAIVLAQANREAIVEFATILSFVAVSFMLVWVGGEWLLVQPMRALRTCAERLGAGDLGARAATEGMTKDLRILGLTFNTMAAELARRDADLNAANRKLAELAATDGLTGLANRRRFDETFEAEWSRAVRDFKSLAVISIDVDNFKKFNDGYGHIAGDGCLRAVAQIIGQAARRPGDLAGRTGGEEFALVLPGSNPHHAMALAEDLRKAVEALAIEHRDNPAGVVTVSIGAAVTTPVRGQRATILLEWADKALYSAKKRGRNQVVQAKTGLSIAS